MKKYECLACGYIYDPEKGDPDSGIEPGTSFEDLPDDWVCPVCGVGKDQFEELSEQPMNRKVTRTDVQILRKGVILWMQNRNFWKDLNWEEKQNLKVKIL